MKKLTKKQLLIILSALAVVIVAAVILFILLKGKKTEEYRIVKVYAVEGDTVVTRHNMGEINAYENMILESGDLINVNSGKLTLKLDDDKYVYAETDTEFELLASGNASDSKTTINLHEGQIANEIQNKLSDDSYYEINTPNSTMSVRGTIYYVSTYIGADGKRYTKVSVFDGAVETGLLKDGSIISGGNKMVDKGNEVLIYTDDEADVTAYDGGGIRPIKYDELPASLIEILETINTEHGQRVEIPDEILQELEEGMESGPFQVTFKYNGSVFGTQTVEYGEKAKEPSIMPAPSGSWDFDFSTPITEDTDIEWK